MHKNRLEAFSDGVIAIIITIMVLELRAPHDVSWSSLSSLLPFFLSYLLSFIYIAIYWNNHHHMMATVKHVNGSILWANMHLLFWLSLVPFATGWTGEKNFATIPTAVYGIVLLFAGVAYYILEQIIIRSQGPESLLAKAVGNELKGKLSVVLYVASILAAFVDTRIADAIFVLVAIMWLVPDRRIERSLAEQHTLSPTINE